VDFAPRPRGDGEALDASTQRSPTDPAPDGKWPEAGPRGTEPEPPEEDAAAALKDAGYLADERRLAALQR